MTKRIHNIFIFICLFITEVLIALFVHDNFIRPYVGDILVVLLIYYFVRIFIQRALKLLPLYVFLFAATIEALQYFDYVAILGLEKNTFFSILLGRTFSWADIVCYGIGSVICFLLQKKQIKNIT